jgi:uncharacterized RDD family membrane protein YckC
MRTNKQDDFGENLWDEPVKSDPVENKRGLSPLPMHRAIHLAVDFTAAFILFQFVELCLMLFMKLTDLDIGKGLLIFSSNFALPLFYLLLVFLTETLSKGQSIGKMITRFEARRTDGKPFTTNDAFLRTVCRLIPFEFIAIFIRRDQRALHDLLTATELRIKVSKTSARKNNVIFDQPS